MPTVLGRILAPRAAARVELEALTTREQGIAASIEAREPLRAPVSGVVARADLAAGQVIE